MTKANLEEAIEARNNLCREVQYNADVLALMDFTLFATSELKSLRSEREKMEKALTKMSVNAHKGGQHLASARSWLQSHKRNGSSVVWGSGDIIAGPVNARDIDDIACAVARGVSNTLLDIFKK